MVSKWKIHLLFINEIILDKISRITAHIINIQHLLNECICGTIVVKCICTWKKNAPGKKCKTFKELQNFWTNQLLKMFTLNLNRFPYS